MTLMQFMTSPICKMVMFPGRMKPSFGPNGRIKPSHEALQQLCAVGRHLRTRDAKRGGA